MGIHKCNMALLSVGLRAMSGHSRFSQPQRIHTFGESDIALPGAKIKLAKGAELIHPCVFDGGDTNIILSGDADFDVANGYRLSVVYNGVVVSATGSRFSLSKRRDVVEVTVFMNEVSVLIERRETIVPAHHRGMFNQVAGHVIIVSVDKK